MSLDAPNSGAAARGVDAAEPRVGTAAGSDRNGRILAARWSIERLHRPAGPELVWLGYAKPDIAIVECLACGAGGFKQGVVRAEGRTFYLCAECASHQVHPSPAPPAAPSGFARRYQLEYAADLAGAAALLADAVAGREQGRLLDLTCGLGWVVDMATQRPGWTAAGIDPSGLAAIGAVALGAEASGTALRSGGAEALSTLRGSGRPFDVVLATGLDRCPAPAALLRAAAAAAAKGARWRVASADAALLYSSDNAAEIRRLCGSGRTFIPSRLGLQRLLARSGLAGLAVQSDGTLLRAGTASPEPEPPSGLALLDEYLSRRLAALPADGSARLLLLARALQRAVERRDWAAGATLAAGLAPAFAASSEAARVAAEQDSLAALLRAAPVCAPSLLFYAGLLQMGSGGPSTQALLCFELCAVLARRAHDLAPLLMGDEADRQWAALFHAGLVRGRMGEVDAARQTLDALAARSEPHAASWASRARLALDDLATMGAPLAATPAARRARKPMRVAP